MQLGELGDRNFESPPSVVQGQSLEAFYTFAHNILTPRSQKLGCPDTVDSDTNGLTPLTTDGGLGCSPSGVLGQSPCSGSLGGNSPEAESFLLHK